MMEHMNEERWQRALSDEVRAELARLDRTAKDAYTSLGISSTAWQTYFKRRTRDVPSHVLLAVADYLGMPLSVLMARTEAREAELAAMESRPLDPPRVNVAKILADSPHLEAVREEGRRLTREARSGE